MLQFRSHARSMLDNGVEPGGVLWNDGEGGELLLPAKAASPVMSPIDFQGHGKLAAVSVPRAFVDLARIVACHRDAGRWGLLYRVLWRLSHGERRLLDICIDEDVSRLLAMHKSVTRDRHKMTAFVRFRRVARCVTAAVPTTDDGDAGAPPAEPYVASSSSREPRRPPPDAGAAPAHHYVAWHRPDHFILRLATPFFVRRFAAMRWTLLTPDESVYWDGHSTRFGPGVPASAAPHGDALEDLWKTYYASIFNPARVNVRAMKRELPVRHWNTLPETRIIPDLLRNASRRAEDMVAQRRTRTADTCDGGAHGGCPAATSAAEFVPPARELRALQVAAAICRGCPIYCNATQVVFGEGPRDAAAMFIGEQPGDQEDRAGKPFVGPAGKLLDEMMQQAGIPRDAVYVTNAVKHFKFEPRGIRRIHAKPSAREVGACRPWLEAEIETIKPRMIVCLGATAAQSLMGASFRVTQQRGEPITDTKWAPWVMATVHPSALLRVPDAAKREQYFAQFLDDLTVVAKQMKSA